ncbi:hypothetical protein BDN72DRAFT_534833 [Pluteus cervinus]|uniref:Uncharacterized protein n=1 Tax=Pluteus cervinus TaxID=181527 RepID=A0ACD3A3T6_9AGAR|nr:hypothetical protein BDN72DRAFT_534833 [Pluteus cervinus]
MGPVISLENSQTNSNVVRFFRALKKDDPNSQLCYYQSGIGTFSDTKRRCCTIPWIWVNLKIDEAIARELNGHVIEGYRFIMRNYRPGDQIYMFGFSRGAYTARALSAMIYKVGVLPRYNESLVDFAFIVYDTYDKKGVAVARKFKKAFAMDVPVHFVGVWDTVTSVGVIPGKYLPLSNSHDGVEVFRHALALDERRVLFKPFLWDQPRPTLDARESEPQVNYRKESTPRNEWSFEPLVLPDVKEVWFVGCHADVGGGSHPDDYDSSLSNITLRWMIIECFRSKTGIKFREDELFQLKFKREVLQADYEWTQWDSLGVDQESKDCWILPSAAASKADKILASFTKNYVSPFGKSDVNDCTEKIYDQMKTWLGLLWWVFELFPTSEVSKNERGWLVGRGLNYGSGRRLPMDGEKLLVHVSVLQRMKQAEGAAGDEIEHSIQKDQGEKTRHEIEGKAAKSRYKPKAWNWDWACEGDYITWVY